MPGLLDFNAEDPSQYQVSDDERRKLVLQNMLLQLGPALAGSRKGQELQNLTYGLANGGMAAQQALGQAQAAKWDKLKAAGAVMDYQTKRQGYQDDQAGRAAEASYKPPGAGGGMASLAPTNENANTLASNQQQGGGIYQQLLDKAAYFDAQHLPKKAQEYRVLAEKYAPKYKGMETVMGPDGKPMLLQTFDNQAPAPVQGGFQPKPDITMQDLGGRVEAIDKLRTQGGQSFGKTATPGELMSNELGQKNYGLSAAHLKLAQDKANQEKGEAYGTPIQITTPEGGTSLMIPRKGTNQLVPMVDAGGNAVTKSASIPQKFKDTSYSLANLKGAVDDYHKALGEMKPADYFKPAKIAEIEAKFGATQMGLKNLFELGAIAGPDMAILQQNLTNPTTLKGRGLNAFGGLEAQNKVIKTMLDRAEENLATSYNQPHHAEVKSQGAYDALPKGAVYTAPDGTKRRKQ